MSAGGKSWWGKGGFEGEVASNLIDVVCTWFFMGGLALSAVWVEWGIPYFCSGADPKDKILTFSCADRVVFGYIYCFVGLSALILPPHTTNPWEVIFLSIPFPRRLVKFGLQVSAGALFAVALNKASSDFADGFYKDVLPRVNLCNVKPFSAYHAKISQGMECHPEWPGYKQDGTLSMGVVLTEAMHVFSLNFVAAVILPRVGALVPMVVPCIVISTIRSPFAIAPGPALNLIPVTAAAVLHGGLEAYRAQCLGCGLGMLLCYLAVKRLRVLQNHGFTSAWSARGFTQSDNEPAPAKRVTRTSKKAEDFVARKKANEEFDPNALASGDFVIKGVTAHSNASGGKSKKD